MIPDSWTTFPIHRGTKKPAVAWGSLGAGEHAPTRSDQDIAVACGERSGVFVLDLDMKGGKNGVATLRTLGDVPPTLASRTPSGGFHLFFRWPGFAVETSVEKLGPGVDVRGDGGYAVIPPSQGYAWAKELPIADAPAWLLELVRKRERVEPQPGAEKLPAGQRNASLTSLAGAMRRHGSGEGAIVAALRERNKECTPPLAEDELRTIAKSVSRYAPADVPTKGGGPTPGFQPLSEEEMLAPVPPPNHLITDLDIGPGRPVQLLGMGSAGKSLIGQAMMLAVVAGKPCFGRFKVRPGTCAWIDFEMGRAPSLRRLRRLALAAGLAWEAVVKAVAFSSMPRTYLNSADAEEHLVELCQGRAALFIDSLRRGVPGVDENDSAISEFLQMLLRVSERTGVTVIFLHHSSTKVPPDGLDARGKGRGSSAIYDGSGAVFHLGGPLGEPVTVTQTRVGEAGTRCNDFQLVIRDVEIDGVQKAGLEVVWKQPERTREGEELAKELLDVIRGENFKGHRVSQRKALVRFAEARKAAGKKNVHRDSLIAALEDLEADDLIEDLNVGGKAKEFWARGVQVIPGDPRRSQGSPSGGDP